MTHSIWIYILVSAAVSYFIRMMPMAVIRRKITNKFLRSFLYYVPYVILAVMTFPAIIETVSNPIVGAISLVIGIVLALFGANLIQVACACCGTVFIAELIIDYLL